MPLTKRLLDVTEHFEEGKASPEVRIKRKRVPVLTFSIMDPDPELLANYVGGTLLGESGDLTVQRKYPIRLSG